MLEELFAKVARHQRVVIWIAQKRCDPLESIQKSQEVCVVVAVANVGLGCDDAVTRRKRAKSRRLDGALEMEMEFGLGKIAKKICNVSRH